MINKINEVIVHKKAEYYSIEFSIDTFPRQLIINIPNENRIFLRNDDSRKIHYFQVAPLNFEPTKLVEFFKDMIYNNK